MEEEKQESTPWGAPHGQKWTPLVSTDEKLARVARGEAVCHRCGKPVSDAKELDLEADYPQHKDHDLCRAARVEFQDLLADHRNRYPRRSSGGVSK